ncbi:DUF262 domain-containing protein [Gemmata sp. JC673]|uniref:DUF262 domain-containing protein n=1 Tax=Gemmata algarum TaxID=2975278 RepID=A0ABU5EXR4_9BACT|nr:DUF262 domain-containing protein [Gemmata algarum]MDY3560092.1 DUF262 domain-containing protein [Gemmata algarum]
MTDKENQPVVTQQTIAQNEAVENVLTRFARKEVIIPQYQRDADQWDDNKKSLFIESVLNRLTIPAFYFALSENDHDVSEVVDGQQRLTTLQAFFNNEFTLSNSDTCPYYGSSSHYAEKKYNDLDKVWQNAFRRYNLTLVTLPETIDLSLRLEIFRRINEGGTPLTGQDIRLSYYSQSDCVRFIQSVGIFDASRPGSKRMIGALGYTWPWQDNIKRAAEWQSWWQDTKVAIGQTASEMFLWYLISEHREKVDALLKDNAALARLKIRFRGNTDEVLDIVCAQFKEEDLNSDRPRLFPDLEDLKTKWFPQFAEWWYRLRMECGPGANVGKHRAIALLIPSLQKTFGSTAPTQDQWSCIGRFLKSSRETARNVLKVEFPDSKGKWTSQRKQLEAFDNVAAEIKKL